MLYVPAFKAPGTRWNLFLSQWYILNICWICVGMPLLGDKSGWTPHAQIGAVVTPSCCCCSVVSPSVEKPSEGESQATFVLYRNSHLDRTEYPTSRLRPQNDNGVAELHTPQKWKFPCACAPFSSEVLIINNFCHTLIDYWTPSWVVSRLPMPVSTKVWRPRGCGDTGKWNLATRACGIWLSNVKHEVRLRSVDLFKW